MEDSQSCPARNLTNAGNFTTSIPFDLTIEILSKLPGKSLLRFQTVSKLWLSTIRSKHFTNSFLARSRTQPRLLFNFKHFDSRKRFIFSAPEHQNNNKLSSTIVARHDMTISDLVYYIISSPVNGFVCCTRGSSIAVCNPTTRQMVKLPDVERNGRDVYARLGYDPVQDEYKVLCVMMFKFNEYGERDIQQEHLVCTVRSGQDEEWRKIEVTIGDTSYTSFRGGICIDGAIYYGIAHSRLIRFDVRHEKIELIKAPDESYISIVYYSTLFNYNGKLAGLNHYGFGGEMTLWVLEDVEKQEWSRVTCAVASEWRDLLGGNVRLRSNGEIHTGELMVVSPRLQSSKPFGVCYYNFNDESIRKVEIEGIANDDFRRMHGIGKRTREILSFPGYFENIMFL